MTKTSDRLTIEVGMPPDIAAWIDEHARRNGISPTEMIIEAIKFCQNARVERQLERQHTKAVGKALDRLESELGLKHTVIKKVGVSVTELLHPRNDGKPLFCIAVVIGGEIEWAFPEFN